MKRLFEFADEVVWIDHHLAATSEFKRGDAKGKRVAPFFPGEHEKIAACLLTWHVCFPGRQPSKALELLNKYDVHDESDAQLWKEQILPFQFGMRTFKDVDPRSEFWDQVLYGPDFFVDKVVKKGEAVLDYVSVQNEKLATAYAFETEFDGLRTIALNVAFPNSQIFESAFDPNKHDVMLAFQASKNGTWKISLFGTNEKLDLGQVAKKYGMNRSGGGHKLAAGFTARTLPFKFNEEG
jgi:hypothetical protein